jgi:hypothetical protein
LLWMEPCLIAEFGISTGFFHCRLENETESGFAKTLHSVVFVLHFSAGLRR